MLRDLRIICNENLRKENTKNTAKITNNELRFKYLKLLRTLTENNKLNSIEISPTKLIYLLKNNQIKPTIDLYKTLIRINLQLSNHLTTHLLICEIPYNNIQPNAYLYENLIDLYTKQRKFNLVIETSEFIISKKTIIQLSTLTKFIQVFIISNDGINALKIFNHGITVGIKPTLYLYNILISLLCKLNNYSTSEQLLDNMKTFNIYPTQLIYSRLISCYLANKKYNQAILKYNEMLHADIKPSLANKKDLLFTYCLQSDVNSFNLALEELNRMYEQKQYPGSNVLKEFLNFSIKQQKSDIGKIQFFRFATIKLEVMIENIFKNIESEITRPESTILEKQFELFFDHLSQYGTINNAARVNVLYNRMITLHLQPTTSMLNNLLIFFYRTENIDLVEFYFEEMKRKKIRTNHLTFEMLIKSFMKNSSDMAKAIEYFKLMSNMNIKPTINIYNLIFKAFLIQTDIKNIFQLFKDMKLNNVKLNYETFQIVVSESKLLTKSNVLKPLFLEMKNRQIFLQPENVKPDIIIFNRLISLYANLEMPDEAEILVVKFGHFENFLNIYSFSYLINAYISSKNIDNAIKLFNSITKYNVNPDSSLYGKLINACFFLNRKSRGFEIFQQMLNEKISDQFVNNLFKFEAYSYFNQFENVHKVWLEIVKHDFKKQINNSVVSVYFDSMSHIHQHIHESDPLILNKNLPIIKNTWNFLINNNYKIDPNNCTSYAEALIRCGGFQELEDFITRKNNNDFDDKFIKNMSGMLRAGKIKAKNRNINMDLKLIEKCEKIIRELLKKTYPGYFNRL